MRCRRFSAFTGKRYYSDWDAETFFQIIQLSQYRAAVYESRY